MRSKAEREAGRKVAAEVADRMERNKDEERWSAQAHGCGARWWIAGWTMGVIGEADITRGKALARAREALALTSYEAALLFGHGAIDRTTRTMVEVVQALRRYAETGHVGFMEPR